MIRPLLALLLVLPAAARADLSDWAFGWPLRLDGASSAWQLELTPEMHEVLTRADLRDFTVLDADGKPVPMGRYTPPAEQPHERELSVFVLPRPTGGGEIDARLMVDRSRDGAVRGIRADVVTAAPAAEGSDYLLDASAVAAPIDRLTLQWSPGPGRERGRFALEASDDLERWRTLVSSATLLHLREKDVALERREISFPAEQARYLRLRALDGADLGAVRATARVVATAPPPPLRWVEARFVREENGAFLYDAPGHFDVAAVRIAPEEKASLASMRVESESAGGWQERARLTFVRLPREEVLRNEATVLPGARTRRWRLVADPALAVAPRLLLGTRPDRFVFLVQGRAPYLLAAGSARAVREDAPVGEALAAIATREGAGWRPPLAESVERRRLGGDEALQAAAKPIAWTTLTLWAVLLGGAALVAALAIRLLRSPDARR